METVLNTNAHVLQVVRVVGDKLRMYTPMTAKDGYGYRFCYVTLNQSLILNHEPPHTDDSYAQVDVLDRYGDIIQDIQITRDQFVMLRNRLKFKWENRTSRHGGIADDE